MAKHSQKRLEKRARIQAIPREVFSGKKKLSQAKDKQVQDHLTPQPTVSTKGKEKSIDPPLVSLKNKKRPTEDSETPLPTSFKVVAGSYEKLLYGLDGTITVDDQSNLQFHLKPIFIFPA